ncbi:MAG: hypothetical protein JXA22_10140 [Candidatus Thermoplasmatota archaeon]|nr:hypothetical protein [Candidatus Thermoplasmatota archaeon]
MNTKIPGTNVMMSLLLLASMLMSSLSIVPFAKDIQEQVQALPTRIGGEDLELENTTHTVYGVSEEWDTVYIGSNSTLVIEGATLVAKRVICRGDTEKTALRILNHESTQGLLSVTEGIINIKADTIEVIGSRISVVNGTSTIPNGQNGGSAEISLLAKSSNLVVTGSEFNIRGHDGGLGDSSLFGGRGGKAYLFLGTLGSRKVAVTGSEFQVEGGAGGNGFVPNSGAGEGGEAAMKIVSETVDMKNCSLFTKGGKAGARSDYNPGNVGGNSYINIESVQDTLVHATDMESQVGLNSNNELPKKSFIVLKSISRKVLWDHQKTEQEKLSILSNVDADTLNIDSKTGAELHQVNTGDEVPQPLGAGSMRIYWWARLTVKDKYAEPIVGAKITYTIEPDPLPYPRDGPEIITDDLGMVDIEVIGRQNQDWNKFTFQAEDYGGAIGSSDQYRFDENRNLDVPIEIIRMTIDVVEPVLPGPVGGPVDFRGTAIPGNPLNKVQNVTLYIDQEVIGYARDISGEGAPAFSLWALDDWDSTTKENGNHELLVVGIDSAYQVRFRSPLIIDQFSVNHRPMLVELTMIDRTGSYVLQPGETADAHVNQEESILKFDVEVYDIDMLSTILQTGEGKKVVKATIDLIHVPTGTVILNDKVVGEDDFEKINLTGGYGYTFEVDTNKKPGSDDPYPEGQYKVVFIHEDDGGLVSREEWVYFDLYFDFFPWILVYLEPSLRPGIDPEFTEQSFTVETKLSHIYTARFNFTDSWDRDDPLWSSDPTQDRSWSNLRYTVEIMDPKGNREVVFGPDQNGAGFIYDFDVTDVPKGEQGIFTIMVSCKDQEDLSSDLRLKIRITHNPPPVDKGLFGQEVGLPGDLMSVIAPAVFILMIIAFLVLLIFIQKRNNDDKNKKMALLDKKRKEEDKAKGTSAIEDEFTGGRVQDASAYLKQSGGDKGREDFIKELESSGGKGHAGEKPPVNEPAKALPVTPAPRTPPPAISPKPQPTPPTPAPPGPPAPVASSPAPPVAANASGPIIPPVAPAPPKPSQPSQ